MLVWPVSTWLHSVLVGSVVLHCSSSYRLMVVGVRMACSSRVLCVPSGYTTADMFMPHVPRCCAMVVWYLMLCGAVKRRYATTCNSLHAGAHASKHMLPSTMPSAAAAGVLKSMDVRPCKRTCLKIALDLCCCGQGCFREHTAVLGARLPCEWLTCSPGLVPVLLASRQGCDVVTLYMLECTPPATR